MFSLLGAFRTATRRQWCRLPATPTAATRPVSYSSADLSSNSKVDLDKITEALESIEDPAEQYAQADDVSAGQLMFKKGYPMLVGPQFHPQQFTRPKMFTREDYNKKRSQRKRSMLGPDASEARDTDLFHHAGLDPLQEGLNTTLLSNYLTSMGKVRGRNVTNLTWKNQRKLGKAIRRAKMMGIIPSLSRRKLVFTSTDYERY